MTAPLNDVDDALLDQGIVLCLQEAEAGRAPALTRWLADHPHLATDLARFLAEEAVVASCTTPLCELAPVESYPATAKWAGPAPGGDALELPRVAGFEVVRELGRGGMGVVYLANDLRLKREVALKMIRTDCFASAREVQRFQVEAEATAALNHPHIVPIYAVGESGGRPFFSMKVLGGSLATKLRNEGPLPAVDAARLALPIARAVHHAHQRGILHRDLKPANILLDDHGEPHVADFGLARRLDAPASQRSTAGPSGTPAYMAPEQARGERLLTTAVDVYGLGTILYEMLTGKPPFQGASPVGMLNQVLHEPVIRPGLCVPGVPADLEAICLDCLAKELEDRYPSAAAVADDLERFLHGDPRKDSQPGVAGRVARAVRRRTEIPHLITWPALCWVVPLVMMLHGCIFVLAWTGQPVSWAWLLEGLFTGLAGGLLWHYHFRQFASLTVPEKQSLAINVAHLLANLTLVAAISPASAVAPTREFVVAYYPALMIVGGLCVFMHGITHWGDFYVVGIAHLPLAFLFRLVPDWSPLLYAAFVAGYLTWAAAAMRHLVPRPSTGVPSP